MLSPVGILVIWLSGAIITYCVLYSLAEIYDRDMFETPATFIVLPLIWFGFIPLAFTCWACILLFTLLKQIKCGLVSFLKEVSNRG